MIAPPPRSGMWGITARDISHVPRTLVAPAGDDDARAVAGELQRRCEPPRPRHELLHQLEERGLVQRHESAVDRRRRAVTITDAGRELLRAAFPLLTGLEERMAGVLGPPEERIRLRSQLRQLRLALRHGVTAQEWDDCVGP